MDCRIKTKAYTYILPFLADEALDIKKNLVNVFIADDDRPDLNDHIFLLYRFSPDEEFLRFEEEVTWSVYFADRYDCDKHHVMVVFKRPEYSTKDFEKIVNGKYSEISKSYKKRIIDFHELPDFSQIVGVLHRKEFAYKNMEKMINDGLPEKHWTYIPREQEASSMFNLSTERYTNDRKIKDVFEGAQNFLDEK